MQQISHLDWVPVMSGKVSHPAGHSPLERLPNELLFRIFDLLVTKNPPRSSGPKSWFMLENLPIESNTIQQTYSLLPCLLVSHRMHNVALPLFYRNIKLVREELVRQRRQDRFLHAMDENQNLAKFVRSLDITEYQNPTSLSILSKASSLLPRLRNLYLQLGDFKSLDPEAIYRIFFGIPELQNLAIENTDRKTDPSFLAEVLQGLEVVDQTRVSTVRSLTCRSESGSVHSLTPHGMPFVDTEIFSKVLPRFPKLQALDLAYTSIDPNTLFGIDAITRLKYLRISNCQENDTSTLARFLSIHPAVKHSLVVFDGTGARFGEQDTRIILANLPPTLRSLNLSSCIMTGDHVSLLQKLCQHLEELSIGHGLSMENVEAAILGPYLSFDPDNTSRFVDEQGILNGAREHELVLGPMRDAIALCKFRRRLDSVSSIAGSPNMRRSRTRYLDLSSMEEGEQGRILNSVLLGRHSMPLEVVVVSGLMMKDYRGLRKICGSVGWRDKWVNGMVWVERR